MIFNARISQEIKTLHEKMKLMQNGRERAKIATELVELDKKRNTNWTKIDE